MNAAVGLVLAAGSARRFGADKRRALLGDGRGMLQRVIESLAPACARCFVVLSGDDEGRLDGLHVDGCELIYSQRASGGMGYSLADAAVAIGPGCNLLVTLADKPFVQPSTCSAVAAAMTADRIVVAEFNGERGHPVGIGAQFHAALTALQGDEGARQLIVSNPDKVRRVAVADPGAVADVDTPEIMRALEQEFRDRAGQ